MKATGIVRRIDDLGRVVIPKEIRRTLRIRDGDPLEIFTEKDGEVIFKKYSPMGEWSDDAVRLCESMQKTSGVCSAVADRDIYITASGISRREVEGRRVSPEIERIMESRKVWQRKAGEPGTPLLDGSDRYTVETAAPVVSEGDVLGCVLFFSEGGKNTGDAEQKLAQTAAAFLGKQMES